MKILLLTFSCLLIFSACGKNYVHVYESEQLRFALKQNAQECEEVFIEHYKTYDLQNGKVDCYDMEMLGAQVSYPIPENFLFRDCSCLYFEKVNEGWVTDNAYKEAEYKYKATKKFRLK